MRYVLALSEINQAIWVLHDKGDAGAFNEGDWAALPDKIRSQLRAAFESLGEWPGDAPTDKPEDAPTTVTRPTPVGELMRLIGESSAPSGMIPSFF